METLSEAVDQKLPPDTRGKSTVQDTTAIAENKIERAAPQALHALVRAIARQAASEALRPATSTRTDLHAQEPR